MDLLERNKEKGDYEVTSLSLSVYVCISVRAKVVQSIYTMVELTSCHIHWHTDCTLPVSQLQLRDLVLKPVYIWGAVRRLVNQGSWSVSVPTRRALRAGRGRAMSRRQVSLVEGTVVNDWLSSILRRLNNNVSCPRPLAPSRDHWLPKRHCTLPSSPAHASSHTERPAMGLIRRRRWLRLGRDWWSSVRSASSPCWRAS